MEVYGSLPTFPRFSWWRPHPFHPASPLRQALSVAAPSPRPQPRRREDGRPTAVYLDLPGPTHSPTDHGNQDPLEEEGQDGRKGGPCTGGRGHSGAGVGRGYEPVGRERMEKVFFQPNSLSCIGLNGLQVE